MAKAASATIEGYSKEKMGAGWKSCPSCGGYVKGPLTKECPACQHKFAFKSKTIAKPASVVASREQEFEQSVMLLALKMGGLSNVTKAVQKLSSDPLMAFAIKCGGVENTLRIVQGVEAKLTDFNVGNA